MPWILIDGVSRCGVIDDHDRCEWVECFFSYQLTRVVSDKIQRAVKWLCVGFMSAFCKIIFDCRQTIQTLDFPPLCLFYSLKEWCQVKTIRVLVSDQMCGVSA